MNAPPSSRPSCCLLGFAGARSRLLVRLKVISPTAAGLTLRAQFKRCSRRRHHVHFVVHSMVMGMASHGSYFQTSVLAVQPL
jgi:hypothetical protein